MKKKNPDSAISVYDQAHLIRILNLLNCSITCVTGLLSFFTLFNKQPQGCNFLVFLKNDFDNIVEQHNVFEESQKLQQDYIMTSTELTKIKQLVDSSSNNVFRLMLLNESDFIEKSLYTFSDLQLQLVRKQIQLRECTCAETDFFESVFSSIVNSGVINKFKSLLETTLPHQTIDLVIQDNAKSHRQIENEKRVQRFVKKYAQAQKCKNVDDFLMTLNTKDFNLMTTLLKGTL